MAITELIHDASTKPTAILIGVLILLFLFSRVGRRPRDLPPGPPTLPVIGNLHQIPKDDINIHLEYQEWAKRYGPIFSLMAGQQVTVVITKGHIIKELVDKKGIIYADRPDVWVRKLFDNSRVVSRNYDAVWRLERRLYHSVLNNTTAKKYYLYQELEALRLCMDLLERPRDWPSSVARATGSVATSIAYGTRLPDMDSPETKRLTSNGHGFFKAATSSMLMDWFPAIRPLIDWIPWSINPLARDARKAYLNEKACFYEYYERGLKSNIPCFSRDIAASQKRWAGTPEGEMLTDHLAAYTAGISFEGGSDTTRASTHGFIKAMMLHPWVQQKAIEELHAVVGADKLPAGEHIPQLKYISAIVKETLRWSPAAIGGFPHATSKEDRYENFRIPKGARIVTAIWAANNDEQDFADPREFRPERQNDSSIHESATATNTEDCGFYSFGAGRRICPGIHLAANAMTIFFARILWAFEILPEIDANGDPLPVDRSATVGTILSFPAPFECRFVPRSLEKAALLRSEWDRLSDELLGEDQNYKKVVVPGRS